MQGIARDKNAFTLTEEMKAMLVPVKTGYAKQKQVSVFFVSRWLELLAFGDLVLMPSPTSRRPIAVWNVRYVIFSTCNFVWKSVNFLCFYTEEQTLFGWRTQAIWTYVSHMEAIVRPFVLTPRAKEMHGTSSSLKSVAGSLRTRFVSIHVIALLKS
jgi:hypothetical protein